MVAKPSKCKFCQEEIEYLGPHRVGNRKLIMQKKNVKKVVKMLMPTTLKEIRSFVCLVGYYWRFIKGFATVARPLTELQSKEACASLKKIPGNKGKFELPEEARKAVKELKEAITSMLIVALPDFLRPFAMKIDTLAYAIGRVLFQTNNDRNKYPIWYASQVLSVVEKK